MMVEETITPTTGGGSSSNLVIGLLLRDEASGKFKKVIKDMGQAANILKKEMSSATPDVEDNSKKMSAALLGIGLNSLFTGMQIQKAFNDIARTATTTFLKIRSSIGPAFSALEAINASIDYFYFAIGAALNDALAPFVPMIMEIVDGLAEWVNENPELTAGIIALGLALGTILALGGQIALWAASLVTLGSGASGISGLAAAFSGDLVLALGLAGFAISALYALWETNFAGFRTLTDNVLGGILKVFNNTFDSIKLVVGGAWKVITGIMEGDSEKVVESLKEIFTGMIRFFLINFIEVGKILVDIIGWTLKAIPKLATSILEAVFMLGIAIGETLIKAFNKVMQMVGKPEWQIGIDTQKMNELKTTTSGISELWGGMKQYETGIDAISSGVKKEIGDTIIDQINVYFPNVRDVNTAAEATYAVTERSSNDSTDAERKLRAMGLTF